MKLAESEWHIMNALWQGSPATVYDIIDRLPERIQWAYTTVKTIMDRLAVKKVIRREIIRNVGYYEPILTQQEARQTALRHLADQAFDGTFGPLMHFLAEEQKLTPKQRRELIQILEKSRKKKGERK